MAGHFDYLHMFCRQRENVTTLLFCPIRATFVCGYFRQTLLLLYMFGLMNLSGLIEAKLCLIKDFCFSGPSPLTFGAIMMKSFAVLML